MSACPHCGQPLFRDGAGGKRKASTSMLVLHKSGEAEVNCPACKRGVIIGTLVPSQEPRKAEAPRPVVPRA